jgi:tetratricopeptide (TPR) repeat protein
VVIGGAGVDFFISYAGPDRAWAEWVGWQLQRAGYSVELDVWDWSAGDNAVLRMSDALGRADRVLALYSTAYFQRHRFTLDEWTAVMGQRPDQHGRRRLVPVRIENVTPPHLLAPIIYQDLFGLGEQQARDALLTAVGGLRGSRRPGEPPRFPGGAGDTADGVGPRLPGSLPAVWNLPPRNPAFTGRRELLAALRQRLTGGDRVWVQALHGMGGVGKTQLAIEYGYLFAGEYELVWWMDAEQVDLIGEQLAELAVQAGWADPETTAARARQVVFQQLRIRRRWLVVFDNASDPGGLRGWLPPGAGHVIVTSRGGGFDQLAVSVAVDVFTRAESTSLLHNRLPALSDQDADRLAAALGDLPLGLAQAAGLLAATGMPVGEYLTALDQHAGQVLSQYQPVGYAASLAATIGLAVDRLAGVDAAAVQVLYLCAGLAPEPIPVSWLRTAAEAAVLPPPLSTMAGDGLALRITLGRLANLGLVRLSEDSIQLHRLTQAVLRDRRSPAQRRADRRHAEQLLVAAAPDNDGTDPGSWPAWAVLLPHLLFLDPATAGADLRGTACNALWYLLMRGEFQTALAHARGWYQRWRAALGPDDRHTLWVANQLAAAHRRRGNYQQAHDLHQDTLDRRRRLLGEDHPDTLVSASNLALVLRGLGQVEQARDLDQDTLDRSRRVLGEDHPDTLISASNLAIVLRELGQLEQARDLHQDTLDRRRRVLGEDHPDTLISAGNLAVDLFELEQLEQARDLDQDILDRRRRVLGEDHFDTLVAAGNLALVLRALGQLEQARDLDQDTLDRFRRVLGADHPETLASANNLAITLRALGQLEQARDLHQDTLDRRRRVLGEDHPDTLRSASNLAITLRELGEPEDSDS